MCPICRCVLYQKNVEDDDEEDAEGEELTREEMMALLHGTCSLIDWASYIGGKLFSTDTTRAAFLIPLPPN